MSSTIQSVATAHDTEGARSLLELSDPHSGFLVAQVVPKMRRRTQLCQDLLYALGQRDDVGGRLRDGERDWELLIAWLRGWPVRELVLLDAQWLPNAFLDDVAGLAATCGSRLWLVAQQPVEDTYPAGLRSWPTAEPLPRELVAIVKARRDELAATLPAPSFPRVPATNFVSFRAEARRQLTAAEFALVDALYRDTYGEARTWLDGLDGDLGEEQVLTHLRPRLALLATADEMVTAVRATQAAAFRHGILLNAEPVQLFLTAERAGAAAITSPETWRRLRAYREPYRGAMCALAAAELGVDDVLEIRLADVAADGTSVTLSGKRCDVPAGGAPYLRAQVALRTLEGAGPGDTLFADEDGVPIRRRMLALALRSSSLASPSCPRTPSPPASTPPVGRSTGASASRGSRDPRRRAHPPAPRRTRSVGS